MRTCRYGSVILQPSSVAATIPLQQRYYHYHYLPPFPIRPSTSSFLSPLSLTFTNTVTSSATATTVLQRDLGVEISDDAVSSPQNYEEAAAAPFVVADEDKTTRLKKKKEKENDSSFDNRFKLRNGREVFEEKAYLVGVERRSGDVRDSFGIEESLSELEQLADTAGLLVVGSTYQKLTSPNPRTYIGSGKVSEIKSAIHAMDVETVIFDDELSAGQLRNLEKIFGGDVRVCDRTALILDIFNQRAATHEASLQAIIN